MVRKKPRKSQRYCKGLGASLWLCVEKLEMSVTEAECMKMGHEITKSLGVTCENSGVINETPGQNQKHGVYPL